MAAQLGLAEGFGLVVQDVMPEGPAAKAGLQKYDVLKLLNDQQLIDPAQLVTLLNSIGKDQEVTLTILRKGQEQKIKATLVEHTFSANDGMRGGEGRRPGPGMGDGPGREFGANLPPEARERLHELPDRVRDHMREVQKRLHGQPGGEHGPGPRDGAGKPSAENSLDQLLQPSGTAPLRVESSAGVTTFDSSKARVHLKDESGEIEVLSVDGQRTLTAKNAAGAVTFTGPLNTPEERAALPEEIRQKLGQIHLRQTSQEGSGLAEATFDSVFGRNDSEATAQPDFQ